MEIQKSAATGALTSVAHLRNLVALQDARSEGGHFAQALLEADRRLTEMPEDVRAAVMSRLNSPESSGRSG